MKRHNLKIFALSALVLLLTLLLAACGSDNTATTAPTTTTATTTASTTAAPTGGTTAATTAATATTPGSATPTVAVVDANLKTTLTIWYAAPTGSESLLKDQFQRFGKMYPNVKVNATTYSPDELGYQVQGAAETGKLPDLILAPSDYVSDFTTWKALQPADKVFDKSFLDGFVPNALGASNIGGTQWGLPYNYGGTAVLLYNKKIVATPPATISDMVKQAKSLNQPQEKMAGLAIDVNEPFWFAAWVGGFGGTLLDSNNQPTLDTPQVVQALQFTHDLVYKDKLANANYEPNLNQVEYAFRDGRLGMLVTGDWAIADYSNPATSGKAAQAGDDKLELGVAPLPKIDATGKSPVPFNDGQAFFFGAKSTGDQLKAAKLFVQYLSAPDQQAELLNKAELLPPTKAALATDAVKNNPLWSGLVAALDQSKPQPAALEMRAIWDAIRPNLEAVVGDTMKPQDAAKQMQQAALDKIKLLPATTK